MTRFFKISALFAALAPSVAAAESITLDTPMKGASLQTVQADMSVYFLALEDGRYEVVATYVTRDKPADPNRLVMALETGDTARFGLPGQSGTLYAFERQGTDVIVRASSVEHEDRDDNAPRM